MKITFVHAPEDYYDQNYGTRFTPLWAYTLAAYVPSHWQCEIFDCRLEELEQCGEAEFFAFGGINQDFNSMKRAMGILRKKFPGSLGLLGGPITWSFEQEGKLALLNDFDYIFILDGEAALPKFLSDFENGKLVAVPKVICSPRFPVSQSKPVRFDLMDQKNNNYYGCVVEASRGCPFLCEFCDIRVLPNNNQTNVKNIGLFIEEIDGYYKRGINKFQIACDNFIGDIKWANECCDALMRWKEERGAKVSLFTWLTINIYKMPKLMVKMRRIGFSILFIGIESVNHNSLLETAKVQNMNVLEDAVRTIHSYGFIIAPGFIFGFDSDPPTVFQDTLNFIRETGTVGGDPSFLMALAGTPLYKRMKKTGRLVERREGIERKKIATNVCYLQDKEFLAGGFMQFVKEFTRPSYQYARLKKHVDLIRHGGCFIPIEDSGYASPVPYVRRQIQNRDTMRMLWKRLSYLARPDRFWAVFKGWMIVRHVSGKMGNIKTNFFYWLYAWTNLALKYEGLKVGDFDLHSVDKSFDISKLAISAEQSQEEIEKSRREGVKIEVQSRFTRKALEQLALAKSQVSS